MVISREAERDEERIDRIEIFPSPDSGLDFEFSRVFIAGAVGAVVEVTDAVGFVKGREEICEGEVVDFEIFDMIELCASVTLTFADGDGAAEAGGGFFVARECDCAADEGFAPRAVWRESHEGCIVFALFDFEREFDHWGSSFPVPSAER